MSGVTSYHFKLDNTTDTNTIETNKLETEKLLMHETMYEGDVEPPVARYGTNSDFTTSKAIVIGTDRYTYNQGAFYFRLQPSEASWYYWSNTGGLNNPLEFLNFTADKVVCANIIGDEQVEGVDTTHVRYLLITDQISVQATNGWYLYARDFWIDKEKHYVRRLQTVEIANREDKCEDSLMWDEELERYRTGILTFSKFNMPITPPIR